MNKVISKGGTAIAYERSGEGPAVILVDGALCSRSFGPMPKLAPLLEQHFTVFTYDRRGRGDSGDTAPYAVEREVEDLAALVDAAGGSAALFGISSGAALALRAAASGLNITKLALYEPPFNVSESDQPPIDHGARLRELIASNRRSDAARYFMRDMVGMPAPVVLVMRILPVWSKVKAVAHTLPYDATIMGNNSLPVQQAESVTIPALVIGGGKSDESMQSAVYALSEAIPGAQRSILDGQTHNVAPKVLAPVLIDFFRKK